MNRSNSQKREEPKLRDTLREDLRRGDFSRSVKRDYRDLKEFYITPERKERLEKMGRIKRWIYQFFWMLKALFLKLTPARRLLLILALLLVFISVPGDANNDNSNLEIAGIVLILFVIGLELKDKILARNELAAGRAVQHALMPPENPTVPGWDIFLFNQPANDVGGDLVDFLRIDQTKFAISIGDVAGKGLGAALFMAKLQATIRALVPQFKSLHELGRRINHIFYRDGLSNNFASLIYLQIESDSNIIRMLNAGHLPPIIVRKQKYEELAKGTNALGLSEKSTYKEEQVNLENHDLFIAYSDGITEARNEKGEFFGEKRLYNLMMECYGLSASATGKKIIKTISNFMGDAPTYDDISLAVLKKL